MKSIILKNGTRTDIGQDKLCIQIGTVMTDECFRRKGLSRFLIEKIISEWKDKADMIYF